MRGLPRHSVEATAPLSEIPEEARSSSPRRPLGRGRDAREYIAGRSFHLHSNHRNFRRLLEMFHDIRVSGPASPGTPVPRVRAHPGGTPNGFGGFRALPSQRSADRGSVSWDSTAQESVEGHRTGGPIGSGVRLEGRESSAGGSRNASSEIDTPPLGPRFRATSGLVGADPSPAAGDRPIRPRTDSA